METIDKIKKQISENPILLYMKGSPKFPSCGFSARAVEAVINCQVPFGYVDILTNPDIRAELPKFANWPTFPQLWVRNGTKRRITNVIKRSSNSSSRLIS